jgi:hypothetical protein
MQLPRNSFSVCFMAGFMLLSVAGPTPLHADDMFSPSSENSTLTEYDGTRVIARVHATHTFIDHEKWGFLRLGFLPVMVAQGVQVQVQSANFLTNALADLNFSQPGLRRVEFRNVVISLLGETEPRLRAVTARVDPTGALELSGATVIGRAGGPVSISKATLQVSGAAAGHLYWHDGKATAEFFVLQPLNNQKS